MNHEQLVWQVSEHLHAERLIEAGKTMAAFSGANPKSVTGRDEALEWCNSLLHWCLNNDRYEWAAKMLWGDTLFTFAPRCTQMVWREVKESNALMLMGAASMSKSYGCGVWLLLDWIRDPEYTSVNLVGPSEDHLKDNLFTHLVTLHASSTLPLPGVVGDLFIGLDPKKRKGAIRGIVIPLGKRPAGRLQGRKRVPRKFPHPKLGKMSRVRFMLDEVEKIPAGIWKDVDNVFANLDSDIDGFKIICAFNPENPNGETAKRCEPTTGWEGFNQETDEVWTSKRGWRVLRLDAAKCENVVEKKLVFPGLQSYEGFCKIIQNAGGPDSHGALTMARACFPREGAIFSVMSTMVVLRMKGEFVFAEAPENVGGVDLALEGGDAAEFAQGRFGKAVGVKFPPSIAHPKGHIDYFLDDHGKKKLRWALQLDQIFPLEPGDTVKMAEQVKRHAQLLKIAPGWLLVDRTGNGAGVHDLLKALWSEEVRGVNYSESATERKILEEDTKNAKEEYGLAVSELWFALKKWTEFQIVRVMPLALSDSLQQELTGRRYQPGKLNKVETKPEYKGRGNPSPNKADAFTLLVHSARLASGVIPSAAEDGVGASITGDNDLADIPVRTDESNRFDDIDHVEANEWPYRY